MSVHFTRSGYEFWTGKKLPPEIAYLYKDYPGGEFKSVTYKEILDEKRRKQRARLEFLLEEQTIFKPCFIWVFFNDTDIYGGWWTYVKTLKEDYPVNFRNDRRELQIKIMEFFPCGMSPIIENFNDWMESFAKTYQKTAFGRTEQGLVPAYAKIENGRLVDVYKNKKALLKENEEVQQK